MTNLTFNRLLYFTSLITIFICSVLLLIMLFSDSRSEDRNPGIKTPDVEQVAALPDGVPKHDWRMILIHHSGEAGQSLESLRSYYMDRVQAIPYHFLIRPDGVILPRASWKKQEWCSQTEDDEYNQQSIGVCVVGNFSLPESVPSEQQLSSLTDLVKHLMKTYSIPNRYVWQRSEVSDDTDSPGKNFPWKQFLRKLK